MAKSMYETCHICDVELKSEIDILIGAGHSLRSACMQIETNFKNKHGVSPVSANALRSKYQYLMGIGQKKKRFAKRHSTKAGTHQLVGLFDIHLDPDDEDFHPAYKAARKYVCEVQPKILLFGGDMGTFDSLSSWNDKKPLIAEGKRYSSDYKVVRDELLFYRNNLPKTEMIYLFGNHEERVSWFVQKTPSMYEHMDLVKDLQLKEMGIKWVAPNKHITIGKVSYAHGWNWNIHHAKKTLTEFSDNIIYGHVHHWQVETRNVHFDRQPQAAISVPCLTSRYPDYKGNKPTRHQNGFITVNYRKDGTFSPDVHLIIDGAFSYAGRTWSA